MSKSILVMDTPENCKKCPCFLENATNCCRVNGKEIDGYCKPDWCPLQGLPKKKEIIDDRFTVSVNTVWAKAWNACIDKLLEGANGNE